MLLIKLLPFLNDILKFFKNIPDLISTSFNDILVLPENLQDILRAIANVIRYQIYVSQVSQIPSLVKLLNSGQITVR